MAVEERLICHGESVTLLRKPIKNVNLRVRPDGSVTVSVPKNFPLQEAEAFLLSRWKWIEAARRRAASYHAAVLDWRRGGEFYFMGEKLALKATRGPASVCREANGVTLSLPDPEDTAAGMRLLEGWYLKEGEPMLEKAFREVWEHFEGLELNRPTVKLRWMTARWGSCRADVGQITLNKRLFALPPDRLSYVLLHECAHLLYPNHGPHFKSLVASLLPDWKFRDAQLKADIGQCVFLK